MIATATTTTTATDEIREDDSTLDAAEQIEQAEAVEDTHPEDTEQDGADTEDEQAAAELDGETKLHVTKLRREAANYRTKLREAEASLEALRADHTALKLGVVARAAGLSPDMIGRVGIDPAAVVGADGTVDTEAIRGEVEAFRRALGVPVVGQRRGEGGGGLNPHQPSRQIYSMADAFAAHQSRNR